MAAHWKSLTIPQRDYDASEWATGGNPGGYEDAVSEWFGFTGVLVRDGVELNQNVQPNNGANPLGIQFNVSQNPLSSLYSLKIELAMTNAAPQDEDFLDTGAVLTERFRLAFTATNQLTRNHVIDQNTPSATRTAIYHAVNDRGTSKVATLNWVSNATGGLVHLAVSSIIQFAKGE